jgi:hypothetical protein
MFSVEHSDQLHIWSTLIPLLRSRLRSPQCESWTAMADLAMLVGRVCGVCAAASPLVLQLG